jgi:hypothetical protein
MPLRDSFHQGKHVGLVSRSPQYAHGLITASHPPKKRNEKKMLPKRAQPKLKGVIAPAVFQRPALSRMRPTSALTERSSY